ncbi:MAG: glutamate--tRNA ligase family protein [Planctomycetota bacterium]|jgi:glutamyl-tRNA synthetase
MTTPITPITPITRLAPSTTGDLHLGHARTFLLTWALARREGWRLLLRFEDLDPERATAAARDRAVETLAFLGIDHDGTPLTQSADPAPYHEAMRRLAERGLVFASDLSRREIREAIAAPHAGGELRFDPSLRPPAGEAWSFGDPDRGHRFATPPQAIEFEDELLGPQRHIPAGECGDFAVWTRDGLAGYQLAVVVDDARQGVTDVVRGDDLLASTARQILLQRGLDLPSPRWWHLPLVHDAAGTRLAKRHDALSIDTLRRRGATPERIAGIVAWWCRWIDAPTPLDPRRLQEFVSPASLREVAARESDPGRRPRVVEETLSWLCSD